MSTSVEVIDSWRAKTVQKRISLPSPGASLLLFHFT